MEKYIETRLKDFRLKIVEAEDILLLYKFIRDLAEYEQMLDQVYGDERTLYKSIITNGYAKALIAYEGKIPVGCMVYYHNFSTLDCRAGIFLEDMFLLEEYRGKGYNRIMISYLCELAVTEGFSRVEWVCLNWDKPSIDFYEKMGARNMCEWRKYRLTGADIVRNADYFIGREAGSVQRPPNTVFK